MYRKLIRKYFYTWKRLLGDAAYFATLPRSERRDAIAAWPFLTTTWAFGLFIERILWSLRFHRITLAPDRTVLTAMQMLLFCALSVLLLALFIRKKARMGIRQSYLRLWDAVLYVLGGPAQLYGLAAIVLCVVFVTLAVRSESQVGLYVFMVIGLCFYLAAMLVPVIFVTRVVHKLYNTSSVLVAMLVSVVWFCSLAFVAVPLNTISENSLKEPERLMFDDLKVASLAEGAYIQSEGERCGSIPDLKEHARQFEGDPIYGGALIFVWIQVKSDDFREEMHGYRLILGRHPSSCEIEAVPVKYGPETHLSFLTSPGMGSPVYAGDNEGAYAKPWDKFVRPSFPPK
jgi:hypothetical protein